MSTATKSRGTAVAVQETVQTWEQTFPAKIRDKTESFMYVRKLFSAAVSNVCYLRAVFPEKCFLKRRIDDYHLFILTKESDDDGAVQLFKAIAGCLDALYKRYLRTFSLGFYEKPDDPSTVLESYTFSFGYDEHGTPSFGIAYDSKQDGQRKKTGKSVAMDKLKQETSDIINKLLQFTRNTDVLPDGIYLNVLLTYHDNTPDDYEPPGFAPADYDEFKFKDEKSSLIKIGKVSTGFHGVELQARSDLWRAPAAEVPEKDHPVSQQLLDDSGLAPSQGSIAVVPTPPKNKQKGKVVAKEANKERASAVQKMAVASVASQQSARLSERSNVPTKSASKESAKAVAGGSERGIKQREESIEGIADGNNNDTTMEVMKVVQGTKAKVNCECGLNTFQKDEFMLLCAGCKTYKHGMCYGIITHHNAPEKMSCITCCLANGGDFDHCPDKTLVETVIGKKSMPAGIFCLYRRCLTTLFFTPQTSFNKEGFAKLIGGLTCQSTLNGLLGRLCGKDAVLSGPDSNGEFLVDRSNLVETIKRKAEFFVSLRALLLAEEKASHAEVDYLAQKTGSLKFTTPKQQFTHLKRLQESPVGKDKKKDSAKKSSALEKKTSVAGTSKNFGNKHSANFLEESDDEEEQEEAPPKKRPKASSAKVQVASAAGKGKR